MTSKRKGLRRAIESSQKDGRVEAQREALESQEWTAGGGKQVSVPLNKLDLSPENFRQLEQAGVTRELIERLRERALASLKAEQHDEVDPQDLLTHAEQALDEFAAEGMTADGRARVEGLIGLARTIAKHDLSQPIVVHPPKVLQGNYEVQQGNRRTLACILLGKRKITAVQRESDGDAFAEASARLVENVSREDLTLIERFEALRRLDTMHVEQQGRGLEWRDLQYLMGISRSQAYKYRRLLDAPADMHNAIYEGSIQSLAEFEQARNMGTEFLGERASDAESATTPKAPKEPRKPGRRRKMVKLGSVQDPQFVRTLIERLIGSEALAADFADVDWDSLEDAQRAWDQALESLR